MDEDDDIHDFACNAGSEGFFCLHARTWLESALPEFILEEFSKIYYNLKAKQLKDADEDLLIQIDKDIERTFQSSEFF